MLIPFLDPARYSSAPDADSDHGRPQRRRVEGTPRRVAGGARSRRRRSGRGRRGGGWRALHRSGGGGGGGGGHPPAALRGRLPAGARRWGGLRDRRRRERLG